MEHNFSRLADTQKKSEKKWRCDKKMTENKTSKSTKNIYEHFSYPAGQM